MIFGCTLTGLPLVSLYSYRKLACLEHDNVTGRSELHRAMCLSFCSMTPSHELALTGCVFSVIYDPQKPDNEDKSAQLFEEFAAECLNEVI